MTPDIEQLCREAIEDRDRGTPGPWTHRAEHAEGIVRRDAVYDSTRAPIASGSDGEPADLLSQDAAFIAAARTREPLLAKALLAERKESERLRAISELRGNEVAKWANESGITKGEHDALKRQLAAMTAALRAAQSALYDAMHAGRLSRSYHDSVIEKIERAVGKEQP